MKMFRPIAVLHVRNLHTTWASVDKLTTANINPCMRDALFISVLEEYIDYYKLAKDYTKKGHIYNGEFTEYGYIMKKEFIENENIVEEEEVEYE